MSQECVTLCMSEGCLMQAGAMLQGSIEPILDVNNAIDTYMMLL